MSCSTNVKTNLPTLKYRQGNEKNVGFKYRKKVGNNYVDVSALAGSLVKFTAKENIYSDTETIPTKTVVSEQAVGDNTTLIALVTLTEADLSLEPGTYVYDNDWIFNGKLLTSGVGKLVILPVVNTDTTND